MSPAPASQSKPTNARAIAALVNGILGLVFFWGGWIFVAVSIAAIVMGVTGLKVSRNTASGSGMATAGLVLGIITVVLQVILLASVGFP